MGVVNRECWYDWNLWPCLWYVLVLFVCLQVSSSSSSSSSSSIVVVIVVVQEALTNSNSDQVKCLDYSKTMNIIYVQ